MWLINTTSLTLEFVEDPEVCIYAILSHTWGDGEVSFQDMADLERARKKQGFSKIARTCQLARERDIEYAWVDTCCIDKSSSAELTEAINSMFRWYKQSHICFVFLSDLLSIDHDEMCNYLPNCRWFTRGWTLQELIAPGDIEFYNWDWNLIGTNGSLLEMLSEITGIDTDILDDSDRIQSLPVARRMSWAASRQTTRVEDLAYCLFGIFDVNLPLIYGEGKKSFFRLQEAIARETSDLSLFAWTARSEDDVPFSRRQKFRGLLAESPAEFEACGALENISDPGVLPAKVSITNQGFTIADRLSDSKGYYLLSLDCCLPRDDQVSTFAIRLVRMPYGYVRHHPDEVAIVYYSSLNKSAAYSLPIPQSISRVQSEEIHGLLSPRFAFDFSTDIPLSDGVKIQKKPLHLWDHATETFITGGSQNFTGIIEVTATMMLPPEDSGSGARFKCLARSVVIFGLQPIRKLSPFPEPWAGLYTDRSISDTSRTLASILAQEDSHGFPHVVREARKFALPQACNRQMFPPISKQKGVLVGPDHVPLSASIIVYEGDHWIDSTLSVELEERVDCSVYRMRLHLKPLSEHIVSPSPKTSQGISRQN